MFQSPTSSSCSSAQAKLLAAVLFLSQLLLNKYFPPVRQSSSTGKSPLAVHTPTLSTAQSAASTPFFSSHVNSIWDLGWHKKKRKWTPFWETCRHFWLCLHAFCHQRETGILRSYHTDLIFTGNMRLICYSFAVWSSCPKRKKKWKKKREGKKAATGKHAVTSILSEIPDQWRHGWEHEKWINTPSFFMFDCKLW